MIDGQEVQADQAAEVHEIRDIFTKLQKSLKNIQMYRHNVERYGEYLAPVHEALAEYLERKGTLSLRLEAMQYKYKRHVVYEDSSRDGNLIFPFWQAGIRLFIFKAGLSADELLRFIMLVLRDPSTMQRVSNEDIVTRLWKEEFDSIEYIVVENFQVMADDDPEEVEIEVEKVVAYLYKQLQSNSDDYLRFARISMDDLNLELNEVDQLRGVVVQGVTATPADRQRVKEALDTEQERTMAKLVVVLFQLLELDTSAENFEDVAEAFVQLLDALLLQENFTAIRQILDRFQVSAAKPNVRPERRDLVLQAAERFSTRMRDGQRIQTIGQMLNAGNAKDPDGLKAYLLTLGGDAVVPLLEMLETLELPVNRRLICDTLVELGRDRPGIFTTRLTHPSSNVVKDMLYVINAIDPPDKFALFGHVLRHPNAVLRLETLTVIGRNPSDECFETIREVFETSEDAQMRAQAARLFPFHAPSKVAGLLIGAAQADSFEKRSENERKSIFQAMAQVQQDDCQSMIWGILEQKGGLFGSKKLDTMKSLAIAGLEAAPSVQALQLLAAVAQDQKKHSKEICDQARNAALMMKQRLLGR
jgi:hypothetical protein